MISGEHMMAALMRVVLVSGDGNDPASVDREVKRVLSESGLDVDAVFTIGQSIVHMARQAQEEPESTVIGAFATGAAMVCILHKQGALS